MEPLLTIRFSPDDPLIDIYRKRKGVVEVTIQIDPQIAVDDCAYMVLANGMMHQDPFAAGTDPFLQERWDLYFDLDKKELWTGLDHPPLPINTTDPLKLLMLLQDCYPGDATPSQVREYLGKYDYTRPQFKKLYSRLRTIIGADMLLPSARGLNPDKVIIIKGKSPWKPKTKLK